MNTNIRHLIETKGFAEFYDPGIFDIIDLDNYTLINTEERNRDNNKADLPSALSEKLDVIAHYLKASYVDPFWENAAFHKYTVWDGVDKDNRGWHTDMFEDYDIFFLCYYDDTKKETGGAVHFKWKENGKFKVETFQPKKGSIFLVSNSRGFWHRADDTLITRRVVSFDFITNE